MGYLKNIFHTLMFATLSALLMDDSKTITTFFNDIKHFIILSQVDQNEVCG